MYIFTVKMYKKINYEPIERTTNIIISISPPPNTPKFGTGTKKRPVDDTFFTPDAKKQNIS